MRTNEPAEAAGALAKRQHLEEDAQFRHAWWRMVAGILRTQSQGNKKDPTVSMKRQILHHPVRTPCGIMEHQLLTSRRTYQKSIAKVCSKWCPFLCTAELSWYKDTTQLENLGWWRKPAKEDTA